MKNFLKPQHIKQINMKLLCLCVNLHTLPCSAPSALLPPGNPEHFLLFENINSLIPKTPLSRV